MLDGSNATRTRRIANHHVFDIKVPSDPSAAKYVLHDSQQLFNGLFELKRIHKDWASDWYNG